MLLTYKNLKKGFSIEKLFNTLVILMPAGFLISISFGEFFLYSAAIIFIYLLNKKKIKFEYPEFFIPLTLFAFFSLISAFFSYIPDISILDMKELFLYLIVPITYSFFNRFPEEEEKIKKLIMFILPFILLISVYQFLKGLKTGEALPRATGFYNHYMSLAGVILIISIYFFSKAVFIKSERKKALIFFLISSSILALTLTRSSWLGYIAGVSLILFLKRPKLTLAIPVFLILVYLIAPFPVKKRAKSFLNFKDKTFKQRIYMAKRARKIIKEKWLFGVGPNMIPYTYTVERWKISEDEEIAPHLHNNLLQIWAERGVFSFLSWLSFIFVSFFFFIKSHVKGKDLRYYRFTGAIMIISFFIAGLFEYNFGDSEVKAVFLFFITMLYGVLKNECKKTQRDN